MSDPLATDVESLLREALAPVEPPEDLSRRMETRLQSITDLAVEELESWELRSMRDPRNWVRPVAAVAIGGAAGAGLVVLRLRRQHQRKRVSSAADLAERTLDEVRRLVPRR